LPCLLMLLLLSFCRFCYTLCPPLPCDTNLPPHRHTTDVPLCNILLVLP
jgi:hypothetical protein